MATSPTVHAGRHKPNHARRPHDLATLDEVVRISANVAAQVIKDHEQQKRDGRWHRRLLARLRRSS